MSDGTTPTTIDQDADWARPLYARQIDLLGELAERGMGIARDIADRAKAAEDIEAAQACAMAYARTARAVRMSLMLQARFIKALKAYDQHAGYLTDVAGMDRKAQVARIIERVAEAQADDEDHVERLVAEATERLDHDDIYGEVLSRPVSELVAMICKDLGLAPDWPSLAQEAWARQERASGPVGWPLSAAMEDTSQGPDGPLDRVRFKSSA